MILGFYGLLMRSIEARYFIVPLSLGPCKGNLKTLLGRFILKIGIEFIIRLFKNFRIILSIRLEEQVDDVHCFYY